MKGHASSAFGSSGRLAPPPGASIKSAGTIRVRVRYCECDPMNVAHHAAYIPWLEIGRTELLRDAGVSYAALEQAGVFLVIIKLEVKYRRPILYDDMVEVRTRWTGGSKVKIEHEYDVAVVERGGAARDEVVAAASTTLACVNKEGGVQMLPEWLMPRS